MTRSPGHHDRRVALSGRPARAGSPRLRVWRLTTVTLLSGLMCTACSRPPAQKPPAEVRTPNPDVGVDTLSARAKAQTDAADQIGVSHQFHFADRLKHSGGEVEESALSYLRS